MKVSDYIVEYLIKKEITDVFGYPGGMVTHLMDSFSKYQGKIKTHIMYNEQGVSMAACGYAQTNGKTGVAYATSGPGATNLITGICNAFMDSIPTVFITGQVNTFEQKGKLRLRQRGFQETDIVSMVAGVTKYAVQVNSPDKIKLFLDKAFTIANEGRKGPVLLDIAMDVMRADVDIELLEGYSEYKSSKKMSKEELFLIQKLIKESSCPVLLLGNGLLSNTLDKDQWVEKINSIGIPVVSSMLAVELGAKLKNFYGFVGAYGTRAANFVVAKSDLVISIGARLDIRQVGAKRENFAPQSKLIRIDIDSGELEYKVHEGEFGFCVDAVDAINSIADIWIRERKCYYEWKNKCKVIEQMLDGLDEKNGNKLVREISKIILPESIITTDVGQNQVWVAQSFEVKKKQRILFSGGHGAMGYSLPAAVGASIASQKKVYSFNGDGGIQMNMQELQVIVRENLPIKVIIINNSALGMIRQFQEKYFHGNYFQTIPACGFVSPNFEKIAAAYGMEYASINDISDVNGCIEVLTNNDPALVEVKLIGNTYTYPKLEYGKPNQDQEPLLERELYDFLMS